MFVLIALVALGAGGYAVLRPDLTGPPADPTQGTSASVGPASIGEGEYQFMTGADGVPQASACDAQTVVNEKRCGDLKIVVIDAEKMPFIARNISLAWVAGKPAVLHKEEDVGRRKWRQNCEPERRFSRHYAGGSCDEYPFASSRQGGSGARVEEVHELEQSCQGGTLSGAYRSQGIKDGDEFVVLIIHPEKIPTDPWTGQPRESLRC